MVRLAVTGGIACGKTEVGRFLSLWDVAVCEADSVAHDLMRPDGDAYGAVVETFGRGILAPDGRIDRGLLGARVFAAENDRKRLNALVHPLVRERVLGWLAGLGPACRVAAAVVPLLYEAGWESEWDSVVCVSSSDTVQMARLRERGLSEEDARLRVSAQMPISEKMERADFVIVNEGALAVLEEQTRRVLGAVLERANGIEKR
jgi:dephospho-CoA kinase